MKRRRVEGEVQSIATSRGKRFSMENENGYQINWTREMEIQFLEEIVSARECNDIGPYRGVEEWARAWSMVLRRLKLKSPAVFRPVKSVGRLKAKSQQFYLNPMRYAQTSPELGGGGGGGGLKPHWLRRNPQQGYLGDPGMPP
ncbi:hypothetical protein M5689_003035 [Euphorbia peplus]|nr:hypothetical protein M5689_003035 [Euphorbia peplus]